MNSCNFGPLGAVIMMAAFGIGFLVYLFAFIRTHQERKESLPWYQAMSAEARWDTLARPDRFTPEGQRWRYILLFVPVGVLLVMLGVLGFLCRPPAV